MTPDLVTPYLENKSKMMENITSYFEKKLTKKILFSHLQNHLKALTFPIQCLVIGGTTTKYCTIDKDKKRDITSVSTPLFLTKEDYDNFLLSIQDKQASSLLISFAFDMDSDFSESVAVSRLTRAGKGHIFGGLIGKDMISYTKKLLPSLQHILIWNDQILMPLYQHLVKSETQTMSLINGTGINLSQSNSDSIVVLEPAGLNIFDPISGDDVSIERLISGKNLFEDYCTLSGKIQLEEFAVLLKEPKHNAILSQLLGRSSLLLSFCIEALLKLTDIDSMVVDYDGSVPHKTNGYTEMLKNHLQEAIPSVNIEFNPAPSQIQMLVDLTMLYK
jgi:hypothetical protein